MCGIHAVIAQTASDNDTLSSNLRRCLCNRGPDHLGYAEQEVEATAGRLKFLCFTSTVLSLRGDQVTRQPFIDTSSGSVLCWNGEAWKIFGRDVQGNDGKTIFDLLTSTNGSAADEAREAATLQILRSIEGPFAFIYFEKASRRIYFGRDRLGRRSLLARQDEDGGRLTLSSVAESRDETWQEVEADGIYVMDLASCAAGRTKSFNISRRDWIAQSPAATVSVGDTPRRLAQTRYRGLALNYNSSHRFRVSASLT